MAAKGKIKRLKPSPGPKLKTPRNGCALAAFGASAGGLEAFTELLRHLPAGTGMAFVLVQHLDPKHDSYLTELLAKSTDMPVLQVRNGTRVEPNHVYVIPPNASMTIAGGVLHLEARKLHPMPIDLFFSSLAEDLGSNAIGSILSGTASDGTLGLKAIKAAGGITFAQDEQSARYDGMPRSAVLSGCVDFVLPPEGIAAELVRLSRHPYVIPSDAEDEESRGGEPSFDAIFTLLRNATGVDFVHYKHATVKRRILRRMALQRLEDVRKYTEFVQHNPGELRLLFEDILINVTGFFREAATYEALRKQVFPAIFQDRASDDPVRIWVPGCATGEEAYSTTICLLEYMRENSLDMGVQVFGTDINEANLDKARAGMYLESIAADVSAERLRRFFVKVNGHYQISRPVRDLCVFAKQNLAKDPPYSKLDVIVCRNVLIYLGPALQARALRFFHYGLKPGGFLVLGMSESAGSGEELFQQVGVKERIYAKKIAPAGLTLDLGTFEEPRKGSHKNRSEEWIAGPELPRKVDQIILARHSPPGVVVTEDLKVLHFRGHTAPYLEHVSGQPSMNLLQMMRRGVGLEIRKLVQKVKQTGTSVNSQPLRLSLDETAAPVKVSVTPIKAVAGEEMAYLLMFDEEAEAKTEAPKPLKSRAGISGPKKRLKEIEEELLATREYLQSIIEEQEIAGEELKSAHEEVQSANEELQSTNEELLTSKEELQSTNEELNTLNEEMQGRNAELTQSNNDLNNLLSSVNIPIVMLGNDLRIRRSTPQAEKVLSLLPTDTGRKITDFRIKLDVPNLEDLFLEVIDNLQTKEREVQDHEGRTYLMTIRPYRTDDNKIDGAVMTLWDVTDRKQAAEVRYRRLFEAAPDSILIVEAHTGEILDVNPFLAKLTGFPRRELLGRRLWETPMFRDTEPVPLQRLQEGESIQRTLTLTSKSGNPLPADIFASCYREGSGEVVQFNIRDVRARQKAEEDQRRNEEQRREAEKMEAIGRLAGGVAHDFNNLLTAILGYCDLLKRQVGDEGTLQSDLDAIRAAAERAVHLTRQLLTFSRKQVLQPKVLNLGAVVSDMQRMLAVMITERIELILKTSPDLGVIRADPGQMEQVVTNLVLNARDAMPLGGHITIETANATVDAAFARTHPAATPGKYVMLSVTDTGTGMDEKTQSHLFEPFFTTKPKGSGTGLGLATMHGIVKQSGGFIRTESELGKGSSFRIYFPRSEGVSAPAEGAKESQVAPRGTETILLVEDEPMVRRLARSILEEAGYRVLEAGDGYQAQRVARKEKRIHLLLSDVVMPRLGGPEAAARLTRQRRDLKVLFMSGYTEEAIPEQTGLSPGFAFLQKPFSPVALAAKVREVLDGDPPAVPEPSNGSES